MKRLIIGDIHGCYDELMQLVEKANLSESDEVIALGDIVDRGPNPSGVFNFFHNCANAHSIMGNHEHKHVLCHDGVIQPSISQQITNNHFNSTEYQAFIDTIRHYPLFLETPEALLVHGAFEPGIPVTEQKKPVLLGTRNGEAYLRKHYQKPWYELYNRRKPIIAGHHDYSRKGEVQIVGEWVFLIDTGCCYGKYLSAILLPDFQIIRVKSNRNYWGIIKQQAIVEK